MLDPQEREPLLAMQHPPEAALSANEPDSLPQSAATTVAVDAAVDGGEDWVLLLQPRHDGKEADQVRIACRKRTRRRAPPPRTRCIKST